MPTEPTEAEKYDAIKELMKADPPKAMKAKYDRDGDGVDPQGSRKMWPMVLGSSPDPDLESEHPKMVLCYQTTGSLTQRGWRCFKVALLSDIAETSPTQARPVIDEDDVHRQSCVVEVDIPQFT